MSYWIYLQAALDGVLALALLYLIADRRKRITASQWKADMANVAETMGELLLEIEKVAARAPEPAVPAQASAPPELPEAPQAPAPQPSAPPEATAAISKPLAGPLVEPVLALAAQGLEAEEIARRVGRPLGEVTLVLGLRRGAMAPAV